MSTATPIAPCPLVLDHERGLLSQLFPNSVKHIQDPEDERLVQFGKSVYMAMSVTDSSMYLRRLADEHMPEAVATWMARNFNMSDEKMSAREIIQSFLNLVKKDEEHAGLVEIGQTLLACLFEFKNKGSKCKIKQYPTVYRKWITSPRSRLGPQLKQLFTRIKGSEMLLASTMELIEQATPIEKRDVLFEMMEKGVDQVAQ